MSKELLTPLDYFIALGQTCLMQSKNYKNNETVILKNGEKHTTQELGGIITTILEGYEKLQDKYDELETEYCDQQRSMLKCDEVKQKKLKTLEIIKEKRVNVYELTRSMNCAEYNSMFDIEEHECFLSQEEYDLLKEVLKNE